MATAADPRRRVPRTDAVLADDRLVGAASAHGRERIKAAIGQAQQQVRAGSLDPDDVVPAVLAALPRRTSSLTPVLNATGAVLHTNLGRAALSQGAVAAMADAAGAVDVEFDLADGVRARRGRGALAALRTALPDAGDVLVVNNGAAALLLAVTALCPPETPEIIWGRGELVEIGDGFRLPALAMSTGATVREVGTTNRSTRDDYLGALGRRSGCVLKVHPSNFRVEGFTAAPGTAELAGLADGWGRPVPLVVDVGSGLLAPEPLLPDEPDMATALRAGADLVTGSGDKLLGGPQAGIVAGRAELVERLRRHPMARALRVDKTTIAALEATVTGPPTPTRLALHADPETLRARASRLVDALGPVATLAPSDGVVGGGGAPGRTLPGWAVALDPRLAGPLRTGEPAVVGRVHEGRLLLDLRAVPADRDDDLLAAVRAALGTA